MPLIGHGRCICAVPGKPVQLSNDSTVRTRIVCQALRSNTAYVGLGGFGVLIRDGEQNTISLSVPAASTPQMQEFSGVALSDIWLDATVANEGVAYVYE